MNGKEGKKGSDNGFIKSSAAASDVRIGEAKYGGACIRLQKNRSIILLNSEKESVHHTRIDIS